MANKLKTIATEEQKKTLRKIKAPSCQVNASYLSTAGLIVHGGCQGNMMAYRQFFKDIFTYGLWEALLYVESYEHRGYYKPGTAMEAFTTAVQEQTAN